MPDMNDIANAFGTAKEDDVWANVTTGAQKYLNEPWRDEDYKEAYEAVSQGLTTQAMDEDVMADVYNSLTNIIGELDSLDLDKYDDNDLLLIAIQQTLAVTIQASIHARATCAFLEDRA